MSRHSLSRIDRVAQMSMQEDIIARKKLEILEKQKTAELAKQVVAAQTAASKPTKKEKANAAANSARASASSTPTISSATNTLAAELAASLPKNSFNNDGSFFENFKKITEAAKRAQQEKEEKLKAPAVPIITTLSQAQQELGKLSAGSELAHTIDPTTIADKFIADFHPAAVVLCAKPPPPPPPPPAADVEPRNPLNFFEQSADDAAFEDFEKSRPPPVVTKPLTQYTGLVPTHSDGCVIPGLGPDSDTPAMDGNRSDFGPNLPASFFQSVDVQTFSVQMHQQQPQQQQFLQSIVIEESGAQCAGSPTSNYVNPFGQQQQQPQQLRPMHFHHPMDGPHLHQQQQQQQPPQHQHMSFLSHMNPFNGRTPPHMQMHQHHMQQQHHQQHFGGPPPNFMTAAFQSQMHQQQHPQMHQQQLQQQQQQLMHNTLHSIPPPNPLQLNTIPPPRALDLAAIPEPTFNLETIKVPDPGQQQDISRVFSDHEFIPTSVESLVELVAENGDEYEDRLRSRKIDMHSSLWFLCDTNSHAYGNYRKKVLALRYNTDGNSDPNDEENVDDQHDDHDDSDAKIVGHSAGNSRADDGNSPSAAEPSASTSGGGNRQQQPTDEKYDPADMYEEDDDDDGGCGSGDGDGQVDSNAPAMVGADRGDRDDRHGVFGEVQLSSHADYDSDSEYMREAKRRNFGQQLKRKHDIDERQMQSQQQHPQFGGGGDGDGDGTTIICSTDDENDDDDGEQMGGSASGGVGGGDNLTEAQRKKRSRWGDKINAAYPQSRPNNPFASVTGGGGGGPSSSVASLLGQPLAGGGPTPAMLTHCTRTNPALLAYARQSYGTIDLDEETWRKCEDHFKVNLLYQDMLRKRNEMDRLARAGRQKYEYDSDEDVQGGTWEHKARNAEMEATAVWSDALTKQAEGKHHIGDFLPPEELRKFMEKYESQQTNREPDLSDYREYKLREDNKGFQMLQKLGWKEGQGLGFDGAGIVDPVNKAQQRDSNQGLGTMTSANPDFGDNEYDAYRKRMMLAYRFRPNPLNNPRRSYY